MDCTAVKYDESSKSCELGSAEKLDRGTNRVSSILITKLFQVVDNQKVPDQKKGQCPHMWP